MPKKACCCDPKGRHVAVACRYYGGHAVRYVRDSIPASAGVSGFTGDIRFIGPDGFKTGTTGFQRVFGYSAGASGFGNPTGVQVRGPYKWEVNIERFDSTRDVIFLTRSGGGSSQYEWNGEQDAPRGGHSSLLQTRIKASLATEAFVGAGGTLFGGGQGSAIGACLSGTYNPNSIAGAGAGGGVLGRGGHGGLTNGIVGLASGGGKPGTQTAGGCAGGVCASSGTEFIGGTGGPQSGWGGGGRYAGGGGDNKAGGGGGASKWPTSMSGYNDISFSQDGSDRGPGNICDPFINYYTVVGNNTALSHAGMAGGANLVPDSDPNFPQPQTTFLGFGNDFNPLKEGVPGIIKVLWIDKYCPCDETKTELPDKMYICLTDAQFRTIVDNVGYDPSIETGERPKFDLDGETYIYLGICTNAYCSDVRLIDGDPENIKLSDINSGSWLDGPAGKGQFMNDCCKAHLCVPICPIGQADCFTCNGCFPCGSPGQKPKYCCEDTDRKPDFYYSLHNNYVWACAKMNFWFPFGLKPENFFPNGVDVLPENPFITFKNGNYEKQCLEVYGGITPGNVGDYCNQQQDQCGIYRAPFGINHPCTFEVGELWQYPHPTYLPLSMTINATLCGKRSVSDEYAHFPIDGNPCNCEPYQSNCLCTRGCMSGEEFSRRYSSFCDIKGILDGNDCETVFFSEPNLSREVEIYDITENMPAILGLTVTIPTCNIGGSTVGTSVDGLKLMCGRRVQTLANFGLDLGTLATTMNSGNPTGVVWQADEPDIWIDPREGAIKCNPDAPAPPADEFFALQSTEMPGKKVLKYYWRPRTYLYIIFVKGESCFGSGEATCNGIPSGVPPPAIDCGSSEFCADYEVGEIINFQNVSTKCIWGIYNLVTMNSPVFAEAETATDPITRDEVFVIPKTIKDIINNPTINYSTTTPFNIVRAKLQAQAKCTIYNRAPNCFPPWPSTDPTVITNEYISCTSTIKTVSVG